MAYDEAPVYHDPPSNEWFGFQAWSMDRVAQYYYVTGDARAKVVLDKWVGWVDAQHEAGGRRDLRHPVDARVERQAGRELVAGGTRRGRQEAGTRGCTSR